MKLDRSETPRAKASPNGRRPVGPQVRRDPDESEFHDLGMKRRSAPSTRRSDPPHRPEDAAHDVSPRRREALGSKTGASGLPPPRGEERREGEQPTSKCRGGRAPRGVPIVSGSAVPCGRGVRRSRDVDPAIAGFRRQPAITPSGISMSSSAEARHLPCASRASDRVTPPPSACCITKLSAPRLGIS